MALPVRPCDAASPSLGMDDSVYSVSAVDAAKREWSEYLRRRREERYHHFNTARVVLRRRFAEKELPSPKFSGTLTDRERARYEAEIKFFDCSQHESVEYLLSRIVYQRYRFKAQEKRARYLDLFEVPARRLIAAERLFQQKLIMLSEANNILVGLHVGSSSDRDSLFGPVENCRVYHARDVPPIAELSHLHCTNVNGMYLEHSDCQVSHRSELVQVNAYTDRLECKNTLQPNRLGRKYVRCLGSYRDPVKGIVTQLEDILQNDLNGNQSELVKIFREFCSSHCVLNESVRSMSRTKKESLINICCLILECEQSQWQSALFLEGDEWKIGMPVSFARLIRLFEGGHITLKDLFLKYPVYSFINLIDNFAQIRAICEEIDTLYQTVFTDARLNVVDQALEDLSFLYGGQR
ncbi:uncharacterized protein LOC117654137 isoform X1 [Thrips palmi]|uniref:Uncharacterized protein LOC117654137 isoform X1 n=1 Tax=Thrips palmi TaxID=161013 RepID=A0A6P9ADB7_THRPL|nr:uncharacterized protein LOC117654137 isoform X1 [Thrips palmi]XP_034256229.1 uncharacterized protein LOC117654137 isoform X1 [Thrips palmi]